MALFIVHEPEAKSDAYGRRNIQTKRINIRVVDSALDAMDSLTGA